MHGNFHTSHAWHLVAVSNIKMQAILDYKKYISFREEVGFDTIAEANQHISDYLQYYPDSFEAHKYEQRNWIINTEGQRVFFAQFHLDWNILIKAISIAQEQKGVNPNIYPSDILETWLELYKICC